ncbi:DnaJ domain-containing protein [Stigmatella sp. ncwal1]|uniref:DnaJ domain-containing protein n=1 Tax=Stigmatella ashevillensis TaxID=2995309 RepID=A0ABT5DQ82_9BACT|nr:DnaJ domain-containing protein [Stigmatella ashevillena]MDC0714526.1 DnaJ domain-containing protein [Stigmatella ashevillena]
MVDLYTVLGTVATADARDLRRAYLRLVQQYHPDRDARPESTERFLQLQAAYEELGDPEKRRRYDARRPGFSVPTSPPPGQGGAPFCDVGTARSPKDSRDAAPRPAVHGLWAHVSVKVRIH